MTGDEGDEEGVEMTAEQESMLEQMLRSYAIDQYQKAQIFPGGVPAYFQFLIQDVCAEYKNKQLISRSVYDFSVDRYLFHSKHRELDKKDAIAETYIDTFEYLIQLKNEFPMLRPPMKDEWRH